VTTPDLCNMQFASARSRDQSLMVFSEQVQLMRDLASDGSTSVSRIYVHLVQSYHKLGSLVPNWAVGMARGHCHSIPQKLPTLSQTDLAVPFTISGMLLIRGHKFYDFCAMPGGMV